jgi:O-methyltransferase
MRRNLASLMAWLHSRGAAGRDGEIIGPQAHAYARLHKGATPVFQPWLVDPDISRLAEDLKTAGRTSLVNWDRLWILKCFCLQTRTLPGEVWETGVYQGGSALFLKRLLQASAPAANQVSLRLFDTFTGLPQPDAARDLHHKGDFSDTTLEEVRRLVGVNDFIRYHPGLVPDTFAGLERARIRLAHIDLDLYRGTQSALAFIYPRLVPGGIIVCDDYGFMSCPGARRAVDEFFEGKSETPIVLPTGQAVVHRLPTVG